MTDFVPFPKIPRLNRPITITEKLDGTNASVLILDRREVAQEVLDDPDECFFSVSNSDGDFIMYAGSRNRWLRAGKQDNYGFAAWVSDNREELVKLGPGHHFGEWWGKGIQRGYGLEEKRFSLFNTGRWYDSLNHNSVAPACCHVVPVLYAGPFSEEAIQQTLGSLRLAGSAAAPRFMDPEGIIVYHAAAQHCFKVTITGDESPKGQ